jgi:hypothetical protein
MVGRLHTAVQAYGNNLRTTDAFHEQRAVVLLKETGKLDPLPWNTLRRGDPKIGEPDWAVTDETGGIVAGFEVTMVAFEEMQQANAKLAGLVRTGGVPTGRRRKKQLTDLHAEDAYGIVAGDKDLEDTQGIQIVVTSYQLADEIIACIEKKKGRAYHNQSQYPVHLIVHEARLLYRLRPGNKKEDAIRRAGEHDKGNFCTIWYVDRVGQGVGSAKRPRHSMVTRIS